MADKRTTLKNGNTLTVAAVAGGSFTQVQERDATNSLIHNRNHMFTTDAARDYRSRGGQ